ncbi:MAG: apolipoprotein N-acyltransferase [Piscinibacter sp.]|uniref:apolipoprotein N-acyltransferase n=1 Tax=Piscinibacter sp. TaxID=1903157 RepID=UPI0025905952|nr:apolipoprotein N-acyltransferase [Piscinibacter sp.]MCW5665643.1 apolipoprotein N-acyltransferase [Piscinibacter sp.]
MRAWLRPALAGALGALQTLAYVHTGAWWLPLLTIGLLARLAAGATPRAAALLGGAYGTAWVAAGTWWLFVSMHRYGGLPAWMAALAVLALAAFLSLYLAAALTAFARWRSGRPLADAGLFAALWLLAELARGLLFTGFPWVASGYAQVDGPLAAWAPWIGVYGLGAVGAFAAALPALAWPLRGLRAALPGVVLPAALLLLPALAGVPEFTRPSGTLSLTLLQGNIPQEEKFAAEHQAEALEWHLRELLAAEGDLVVAPETAIPFLPQQMPEGLWERLQDHFRAGRTAALIGVPLGDMEAGYTNSAVGFAPGVPGFYRYDKFHLVPFGEFIPFAFKWFTRMMNIPLGDFERGPLAAPSFELRGERVAPNICYEDLFGEELAARFVDAAQAPTVLANLSNIGWFGETIAIPQHLQISRLRTLELQRPMLRATNTGATVVIDHRSRVTAALAPHTRGVLKASVQGRTGNTPYAAWAGRLGLWPLVLLAALAVALAAWRRRAGP